MENIMLQDEKAEWIKIIDFGLSNIYNEENPLKTLCGSPEYAAPELFVKGKKYGPEVDLWSFGVILYVMGTGRLPFTSPRDESSSADERRRRLMVHINRGLSAPQERFIVTLSDHYKNLLRLALMPVAHKRIRLGELRRHPWMFDASTNSTYDQLQLSLDEHEAIVRGISSLLYIDSLEVKIDIISRRFGNIGGIYNIMAHGMQLRKLRSSVTEVNFMNALQNLTHNLEKSSHELPRKIKIKENFPTTNSDYLSNKSDREMTQSAFVQNKTFNFQRTTGNLECDLEKTKKKCGKSTMLPCLKKITRSVSTQVQNNKIHATKEHLLQKPRKSTVDPGKLVKLGHLQTKHKVDNTADTRQRDSYCDKKYSNFRLGKSTVTKKSNTPEQKNVIPKKHDRVKRLLAKVNVPI